MIHFRHLDLFLQPLPDSFYFQSITSSVMTINQQTSDCLLLFELCNPSLWKSSFFVIVNYLNINFVFRREDCFISMLFVSDGNLQKKVPQKWDFWSQFSCNTQFCSHASVRCDDPRTVLNPQIAPFINYYHSFCVDWQVTLDRVNTSLVTDWSKTKLPANC